jgi:DNA-binding MarR family transcriptional regulator
MSRPRATMPDTVAALLQHAPYVSALLRMAYRVTRERSLRALMDRGFTDLNQALLSVFFYPPPDGVRPIDHAANANMTKQAMNYLLSQLESLGYMERRAEKKGGRRLVYLTPRGWLVIETIWTAQQQLESEWARFLGKKRFNEFMSALRQISPVDSMNGPQAGQRPNRAQRPATINSKEHSGAASGRAPRRRGSPVEVGTNQRVVD